MLNVQSEVLTHNQSGDNHPSSGNCEGQSDGDRGHAGAESGYYTVKIWMDLERSPEQSGFFSIHKIQIDPD